MILDRPLAALLTADRQPASTARIVPIPLHRAADPSSESRSISVVLPAYNEEAVIEEMVLAVDEAVGTLTEDYEIVVTNDGSRDGTGRVLAELQARRPYLPLRVVTHEVNQGYGAALASGFDAAEKELIFFTDGDQQFDVREIGLLLAEQTPK